MSWRDYWNQDTPIYSGERHKLLHYRGVSDDIASLIRSPGAHVLDYGCGEALFADRVAQRCAHLYLCDGAPMVRERLVARFGGEGRISVLAPEEMGRIPAGSLDLVVVNSLLQYLPLADLRALLPRFRDTLAPGGRLVLADVIPPDVSPVTDARALLGFAWRGGFLLSALAGLARTAVSDYRRIRDEIGLAQYTEDDLRDILGDAGFAVQRMRRNLGHNAARMTFEARPDPGPADR
ncbi:MAG: class I SAM-dependent methyltransferase [Microvirga sp.]